MSFSILNQASTSLFEIKRSKFYAYAQHISDRGHAMEAILHCKEKFPDARHHCWAYLLGPPSNPLSVAMSDDGEPSGTAGKPMLNVLQYGDVGNIIVVISRYFGGIKLGAGGLVRAYSAATQAVLECSQTTPFVEKISITINCQYAQEQFVRHLLTQIGGEVVDVQYDLTVNISFFIPLSQLEVTKTVCETHQLRVAIKET